jgi:hypothetical protein
MKTDSSMKTATKSRKAYYALIPLGLLLVFLLLYYESVLTEAGRFLAPEGRGEAEVVIVEGAELRKEKAVDMAIRMLSSGSLINL